MPGASEEIISDIERRIGEIPPVSKMIEQGIAPEEMLAKLVGEEELKIVDQVGVEFYCNCSKERISQAIISLGKEEIEDMIKQDHGAETRCHFCNETYVFSEDDLKQLLLEVKK